MAKHIDSVADLWVPALTVADFIAQLQHGDILFCSGAEAVSHAIEGETKSPWSHVGYIVIEPNLSPEPLIIEAVFKLGVVLSRVVPKYITGYNGDLVLTRRTEGLIPPEGIKAIVQKAFSYLGQHYDWESEVEQAAHMLANFIPEHATSNAIYCSGLVREASTAWSPAIQKPNPNVEPSPEDVWCDPTVQNGICKLLKGTK